MIKIVRLDKSIKLPSYAHEGDAGLDVYSAEDCILKPNELRAVKTGIKIAVPKGFVALIWDKSGLAANHGIKTMGGVVDSNYRGEVQVIVKNLGSKDFEIKKNNKIAQVLIQPVEARQIVEVEDLDETNRGEKGFGSTGL